MSPIENTSTVQEAIREEILGNNNRSHRPAINLTQGKTGTMFPTSFNDGLTWTASGDKNCGYAS